ncbi:hypothetical protein EVAR_24871_1 [Eumeta japonica]|uniref:Uncharacterized protein n=1 Tax=Eumeta variegata TaxID=151549 RepID=A0A4C1YAA7_EUMVA|nr:hypothetical protein EVAR_24871_1 [Eumeta japonica]
MAALLARQQRILPPKLKFRGQEVEWQTSVRYLGVQIDRFLRIIAQGEQVIHKSRAARGMLHMDLGIVEYRSRNDRRSGMERYEQRNRSRTLHEIRRGVHQKITRRMFNFTDQSSYEFRLNILLLHDRSSSCQPFPQELLNSPPPITGRVSGLVRPAKL